MNILIIFRDPLERFCCANSPNHITRCTPLPNKSDQRFEDIAQLALFLGSDAGRMCTRRSYFMDAGLGA